MGTRPFRGGVTGEGVGVTCKWRMSLSLLLCCVVALAGTFGTVFSGDDGNGHLGPVCSFGGNAASAQPLLPASGPVSSALDMLAMISVISLVLCCPPEGSYYADSKRLLLLLY